MIYLALLAIAISIAMFAFCIRSVKEVDRLIKEYSKEQ
jgi:uncharacterized protein YoxC